MVDPPIISASTLDVGFLECITPDCGARLANTFTLSGLPLSFTEVSVSLAADPWYQKRINHNSRKIREPGHESKHAGLG